ncbi:MAG: hypothetical protein QM723_08135 [Myxococcaceae bacterium]
MNHSDARAAIEALFSGERPKQADLRAHLDGCLECRGYYDNAARAFRAVSGRPDEMTEEELWLFQPAFPEVEAPAGFRVPVWLSGALTVALAASIVFVFLHSRKDDEFGARGNKPVRQHAAMRLVCAREGQVVGEPSQGSCQAGDALMFAARPSSKRYVAIAIDRGQGAAPEVVVDNLDGELGFDDERVLLKSAPFSVGLRGVAVFGEQPVPGAQALQCLDEKSCPRELERVELPLGAAK